VSEFTALRETVETLANRAPTPEFGELERRAIRRGRRRVAVLAVTAAAAITGSIVVAVTVDHDSRSAPLGPPEPLGPAPNGWVATAGQGDAGISLVRPGEHRRIVVPASGPTDDACPAWSPDGTRLLFGRLNGADGTGRNTAELVIVPVGSDGAAGGPTRIELPGFEVVGGFDRHPCGTWAPDGRWVAFAGNGQVWLVDTQTRAIRRLPNLRPSDLEWRPRTDELAIAGDVGTQRSLETLSTPVILYSVSTGAVHRLGSVKAAHLTWSPDGRSLAYTGGENDKGRPQLWLANIETGRLRLLVADLGESNHGIGPVWSPTGERIVFQRLIAGRGEAHEVVLVNVADGTQRVINPPTAGVPGAVGWYPFAVSWSPDGTTLLYSAWAQLTGGGEKIGLIAVPADNPRRARPLVIGVDPPDVYSHSWTPTQMWGRQPG